MFAAIWSWRDHTRHTLYNTRLRKGGEGEGGEGEEEGGGGRQGKRREKKGREA